jgi:hypothetical protein
MKINEQKSTLSIHNMEEFFFLCYQTYFPYEQKDFDAGLKYTGFQLKPKCYRKEDWHWLIDKLEKRLKYWSFRWLSRVDRLVLVKSIMEAVPFYWMSLMWIHKGILDKVRQLCFNFLWVGSKEQFVIPWVKWKSLAALKMLGGSGLKNILFLSNALVAKANWRLITYEILWTKVVTHK